jgi:hypothetical protein
MLLFTVRYTLTPTHLQPHILQRRPGTPSPHSCTLSHNVTYTHTQLYKYSHICTYTQIQSLTLPISLSLLPKFKKEETHLLTRDTKTNYVEAVIILLGRKAEFQTDSRLNVKGTLKKSYHQFSSIYSITQKNKKCYWTHSLTKYYHNAKQLRTWKKKQLTIQDSQWTWYKNCTNFWQNKLHNRIIINHHQVGFLLRNKDDSTYAN